MWACARDNVAAAHLLLQRGASLWRENHSASRDEAEASPSPLSASAQTRLASCSASPSLLRDSKGASVCVICAQHNALRCLVWLLHLLGPQAFAVPDDSGCTPAHWAAFKARLSSLVLL